MYTVWLQKSVYTHLLEEAIQKMPCETGGVLMGYWGNTHEAVVTAIIGPGPNAIHRERMFKPDNDYHTKEIARHYELSRREETYLGDWHTHPGGPAYLSGKDEQTLRQIASYAEARLPQPLMMILGTRPFGLKTWLVLPSREKPIIAAGELRYF